MKILAWISVMLTAFGCDSNNKSTVDMNDLIKLKANTVIEIESVKVGCGNIMEDEYILASGEQTEGITIELAIFEPEERITVGVGSVIKLGSKEFEIVEIKDVSRKNKIGYALLSEKTEK